MTANGSTAADFIRRVVGNDRLDSLPEELLSPQLAAVMGVNVERRPQISFAAQTVGGTIGGAIIGYFFGKVSKAAALAAGGGILLLQTGVHLGYMSLGSAPDLQQLQGAQNTSVQVRDNIRSLQNRVEPYMQNNPVLISSLIAGICLGYGLS